MISKTITTNPAPLWGGKKTKQPNKQPNQTKTKPWRLSWGATYYLLTAYFYSPQSVYLW